MIKKQRLRYNNKEKYWIKEVHNMYIEKLKYYIDLYDCRSFTETAKKNFISQASISQYITSLEKEFQVQLFDRKITPIKPTKAGEKFYQESLLLWKQYENMQSQMKRSNQATFPVLRLAYTSIFDLQLLLPFVLKIKETNEKMSIQLEKVACRDIENYIERQICDIGLSFSEEFTNPDFEKIIVKSGCYQALVGKNHPLFAQDEITVEELYQYPLLMLSEESMGESFEIMRKRSLADGFTPQIERTVDDFEVGFFYILTDNLLGFVTSDYHNELFKNDLRAIPISDSKHIYQLILAYLTTNQNPALSHFLELLEIYLSENQIGHLNS